MSGECVNVGKAVPCAECGAYFRTTDWPPAVCPSCRRQSPVVRHMTDEERADALEVWREHQDAHRG